MKIIWYYDCKLCGANEEKPIAEFMKDHAHGVTSDVLLNCSIVKHRSRNSINRVTIKLPPGIKRTDTEYGDRKLGRLRIWFTGASLKTSETI